MNEKVKQTLQKGKEIATPVCIKAKALALQGFAKGNELMDRVSFLQKPLHKKIVWSIAGLFLLWVVFPLGEKSGSDTSEVRIGESNGSASANNSGFQKIKNIDALFFEGTNKVERSDCDSYIEVEPNLIQLPKNVSLENLCGAFNPELESERHEKGTSYLNDENGMYYCKVVHVGKGFVIAEPDSKTMYGDFCGYIETEDEYVEGQTLKSGFYTLCGRKSVPLVNGSTRTMFSFRKASDRLYQKVYEVAKYNDKARKAAEDENYNRLRAACKSKEERQERRSRERDAAFEKECTRLFKDEIQRFNPLQWKKRFHVATGIKDKISISCEPYWTWHNDDTHLSFDEYKNAIENVGGSELVYYKTSYGTDGDLKAAIHGLFADCAYSVEIACSDNKCKWRAYAYGSTTVDGIVSDYAGGIFADFDRARNWTLSSGDVYIIDINEDTDLCELGDDEINGLGNIDFGLDGKAKEVPVSKFKVAFEKKYGKEGL